MSRYALYCLPGGTLGAAGAAWLGWDAATGQARPAAAPEGWVARPRRYGFHATLKPPMRLAPGRSVQALETACADLAARLAPARAEGLEVTVHRGFVALTPVGAHDLGRVADACVDALDAFRAPAPPEETARRRAGGLTPAQEANLVSWGYPFVMDTFRFHITLSGRLADPAPAAAAARAHFGALPTPFILGEIALCEEGPDGAFRLRRRHPLTG